MPEIDWRRIAVQVARAGDGSYRLLTTAERDILETAIHNTNDIEAIAADIRAERTADAASGGEPQ